MKIVITGATGFLGQKLVNRLANEGLYHPTQSDLPTIQPKDLHLVCIGRNQRILDLMSSETSSSLAKIELIKLDLADTDFLNELNQLTRDAQIIIHSAAKCDYWGPYNEFYDANVKATKFLVESAIRNKVGTFIHISTPSVYAGTNGSNLNISEKVIDTAGVVKKEPLTFYIQTKQMAEEILLSKKNQFEKLIILRPRALFGPGDETILPKILHLLKQGRFPLIDGANITTDLTYIQNVVDSILCAATIPDENLDAEFPVYNVTNGEGIVLRDLIDRLIREFELPKPKVYLPFFVAWYLASFIEFIYKIFNSKPPLIRYLVLIFGKSMTLDISRARRDLKYVSRFSLKSGLQNTIDALKFNKKAKSQ